MVVLVIGTALGATPTIFDISFGIHAMPIAANFGWPTLDTVPPAIIMIGIFIHILALTPAAAPACGATVPTPPAVDGTGLDIYCLAYARMAFGGGAETWLRLQMAYDLGQARQHESDINVKPVSRRKLHEPHP
jgi:hypothetical protein